MPKSIQKKISKKDFLYNLNSLNDFPLTRIWRGYGAALFLEFGKLDMNNKGKRTLSVSRGWVMNLGSENFSSSEDDLSHLDSKLPKLSGVKLKKIELKRDYLRFTFTKLELIIELEDLSNSNWFLEIAKKEFMTTSDGNFIIEKEG